MSAGTYIIQKALQKLGAHSVVSQANPEDIQNGKEVLNGLIAEWQDDNIDMGCVPLKEPGSELSEPLGARNHIINILSIKMAPDFEEAKISDTLKAEAAKGLTYIKRKWRVKSIPKAQARSTLPKGQGNKTYGWLGQTYFEEGEEIG